jgi:hypothetical protein
MASIVRSVELLVVLSACAGEPVIVDIGQDKVRIARNGAPAEPVRAKADEACGMYKR